MSGEKTLVKTEPFGRFVQLMAIAARHAHGTSRLVSVATPKDLDERIAESTTYPEDIFNKPEAFVWKAESAPGVPAGSFPKGNFGQEVIRVAPVDDMQHRWWPVDSIPGTNILGINDEHGNPEDGVFTLDDLDKFYWDLCGAGKWIIYESKCGDWERIEHIHDQLDGLIYGSRIRYYK